MATHSEPPPLPTPKSENTTPYTSMRTLETAHTTTEKPGPGPPTINPHLLTHPTPLALLTTHPTCIDCPHCAARTLTRVERHSTNETDRHAILCCLVFGLVGACIPYCCHMYYEYDHFCMACGAHVAHLPVEGEVQIRVPVGGMPLGLPERAVVRG